MPACNVSEFTSVRACVWPTDAVRPRFLRWRRALDESRSLYKTIAPRCLATTVPPANMGPSVWVLFKCALSAGTDVAKAGWLMLAVALAPAARRAHRGRANPRLIPTARHAWQPCRGTQIAPDSWLAERRQLDRSYLTD